jgi:hypothetical protein
MGLDMYLNAKRFLWHSEDELGAKVAEVFPELKGKRVKEIIAEAIYWRKSNMIHAWFVQNVQDGTDDCGNYEVSRAQLTELRQLIIEALANKDSALLPTVGGFFFGTTDIDDWYWEDLRQTEAALGRTLEDFTGDWDFEYHSSW